MKCVSECAFQKGRKPRCKKEMKDACFYTFVCQLLSCNISLLLYLSN